VGAFTLSPDLLVAVSSMAHGNDGFQRWLLAFNGAAISPPSMTDFYPKGDPLAWHVREVFKGEGRYALDLE
jgi:putative restriction endonuclease